MRVAAWLLLAVPGAWSECAQSFGRLRGGSADPQQLINGAGEFLGSSATAVAGSAPSSATLSVVASVGGKSRSSKLLNAVFGTRFATALQLGPQDPASAGAWLASSPSMPGCLVLETRPLAQVGKERSAADSCKLTTFCLSLADALIMHSPCVKPTAALVKETYERVFSHHLAAMLSGGDGRTMLVHVRDPDDSLPEAAVRAACKDAWSAATAATEFKGKAFSDLFELVLITVPAESDDAEGFEAGVEALRSTLSGVGGRLGKASGFADVAKKAWEASGAIIDQQPSEAWLTERYLAGRSYEAAFAQAQVRPPAPPPPPPPAPAPAPARPRLRPPPSSGGTAARSWCCSGGRSKSPRAWS